MLDDNIPQPWRARTTLVLTLTLVAVGLGNLQRIPFLMGEHGGAAFFLSYMVALLLLSAPVLIAEVSLAAWAEDRLAWHCTGRQALRASTPDGVFWAWRKLSCR